MADPYIDSEIEESVIRILRSKKMVSGETVNQFEEELSKYIGVKHVVAVSSGTAALHVAFTAFNVVGKDVLTSAFSFAASANSVLLAGGKPVFADIELDTYNLDPSSVEERLTDECIAIEPVHLYGQTADMSRLIRVASKNNVVLIEDAAQAIGARHGSKMAGSLGLMGCFSTYATKNLHTMEGGFVATDDDFLAQKLRLLINHGQASRYNHVDIGYNYRMMEVQAAIGLPQMKKLESIIQKRRRNAKILTEGLQDLRGIVTPFEKDWGRHVYHQYTLRIEPRVIGITREKFAQSLLKRGIESSVHYPTPIYLQPYYIERFKYRKGLCPNSELAAETVLSIPVHQSLTDEQLGRIVGSIREIVRSRA
jgi:perosamine synthetase